MREASVFLGELTGKAFKTPMEVKFTLDMEHETEADSEGATGEPSSFSEGVAMISADNSRHEAVSRPRTPLRGGKPETGQRPNRNFLRRSRRAADARPHRSNSRSPHFRRAKLAYIALSLSREESVRPTLCLGSKFRRNCRYAPFLYVVQGWKPLSV